MRSKSSLLENIDWLLLSLYMVLVILGWFAIYAASFKPEYSNIFDLSQPYGKQLIWILASLLLAAIIFLLDTQFFKSFAYSIYGITLLMLVLILLFGTEIKGSKSWFVISNSLSIQPAEFAKYGTALALSAYLSGLTKKFSGLKTRTWAVAILVAPALLIMLQPDTGSTLVYASFIFVLYREGLSGNFLLLGVMAIVLFVLAILLKETSVDLPFDLQLSGNYILILFIISLSLIAYYIFKKQGNVKVIIGILLFGAIGYIFSIDYVFNEVLLPHQKNRINDLLGITSDPLGAGYNVNQSKIAIGSGGLSGKGFLQGTQTKYDFVPEQNTDFIFCTVGEEWGFIGTTLVILLFIILLFRIIFIAERQRSKFTRIFAYCVASIFFIHFAINIGMTIGLAPVIGIPLPFFSYGGSSLWGFSILLFTLLKLDSERKYVLR